MQMAVMPGHSPSSSMEGEKASAAPEPPVSSSDGDRLRASMEAWKRSAALASERYGEARQRQIAAERDDRNELRKRWLEEEAKKRAESVVKQKEAINGCSLSGNMPPPLYQSTPINNRDRKRHHDSNDYGHEEWRQGFRLMEGSATSEMSKTSTDTYINYPQTGIGLSPGMMMPGMHQQSNKGMIADYPTRPFPSSASYPLNSYSANDGMSSSTTEQFFPLERAPRFCEGTFQTQCVVPSTLCCSPMPSTSTADLSLSQRYHSMELPQFPTSSDCIHAGSLRPQQTQFPSNDPAACGCDMRPSSSMCPTSPNEVPTPPALVNSSGAATGNCTSSATVVEPSLRSPAEDLGCNAVNEDNMTKVLTSIRTDSLGMLGADAVDSLFDNDTAADGAAGQVSIVTSTEPNSSPTGFSHGGPQSVHSIHSAPQSNGNCNPPSTPTIDTTASIVPHSTTFPQVSASQSTTFPHQSPSHSSVFPKQSPSQQSSAFPSAVTGRLSPFPHNSQTENAFFAQPSSSQCLSYPTTMENTASFTTPSSQSTAYATVSQQPPGFPQHSTIYPNSFPPTATVFPHTESLPSTSNPYAPSSSATGMGSRYPIYDMPSAQMSQQQMLMQAQQQQQQMAMAMGGGPGAAMNAQQYHMAMIQKHQQNVKAMMQQRAAMYHGYPNGAAMSRQQYFMHMQKMQQTRFHNGIDHSEPAFMSNQRMVGMRGSQIGAGVAATMEPMAGSGTYPQYSQTFAAQQQYVGQFSMN
uniref:MamL-1 domain-containing protein n=1 Tax=Angiostrongylus cantonensis TaxID=6313 RepID=A0A0K0DHY1_ANGCA